MRITTIIYLRSLQANQKVICFDLYRYIEQSNKSSQQNKRVVMAILRSSSSPSPLPLSDCGATEKDLSTCVAGGSKPSCSSKSRVEKGKAVEDDRVVKRVRKCASLDSDSEDELDMDIFNGAKALSVGFFYPITTELACISVENGTLRNSINHLNAIRTNNNKDLQAGH
ncbi:hypothetical protein F8388_023641 [Cannabis sativa]|uniref:Uncharacterized protein n=1 Tax=Cannabis sativa TaxID=3483 RepID=A0A7J6G9L7_CANSA|nr:hypothetical protein F8388_023641 [Cannabis sativa]